MPNTPSPQVNTKGEASHKFVKAIRQILSVPKEELAKREAAYQQERAVKRASRKVKGSALLLLVLCCLSATSAQTPTPSDVTVGTTYDITRSVELRDGPGLNHEKKINQKASDIFRRIDYLSVDPSTTVKVLAVKDDWAEIQVVEPASFAASHQGWIPISALKRGKATSKRNGYISHTCFVYAVKDTKSKRVGYLTKGSALSVVDDGSGWLEIPKGRLVPVMDMKTNDFLNEGQMERAVYFEVGNFTEISPARR